MIAEKDIVRRAKNKPSFTIDVEVEDIYSWVEAAHWHLTRNPQMIINCFHKAGYTDQWFMEEEDIPLPEAKAEISVNYSDIFERLDGEQNQIVANKEEGSSNQNILFNFFLEIDELLKLYENVLEEINDCEEEVYFDEERSFQDIEFFEDETGHFENESFHNIEHSEDEIDYFY